MSAREAEFVGQVAVVTGGGSGIGRSTAVLLARLGAAVHVADLNQQGAEAVAAEINAHGGRASGHAADVTSPASVEALAERVFSEEGPWTFFTTTPAWATPVRSRTPAMRRKQLIRTVPRHHVVPSWFLRRVSARAAQPLARISKRLVAGGG